MADQIEKNRLADAGLLDDFEKMSDMSQPIDAIIAIRTNDPKKMKEGQETKLNMLDTKAFGNDKFFR